MAKRTRDRGKDIPGLIKRMKWLLLHFWNNNRSAMARDLGCSHTAIYKITRLGQSPGPQILAAIKSHPRLNFEWVLDGRGEPFVPDPSNQRQSLPISDTLLPGSPDDHPDLLSTSYFPVAEPHYRPSRYWYRIGRKAAILKTHQPVVEGDLLLLETDSAYWAEPDNVQGRLCAVLTELDDIQTIVLARVSYWREEDDDYILADVFPQPPRAVGRFNISPRRERELTLSDVKGVCVLLVRQ